MKAYRLGIYEKALPKELSWKEKIVIAKNNGFDYIEMSIDETDEKLSRLDMSKKERIELVNLLHDEDFTISSICLSGHRRFPLGDPCEDKRKKSLEIMEKAILLASDLGVRIIQLAGYDTYYEQGTQETRDFFEKNLKISVEMAAKYGVMLGFETMETPFMDTVEKAMNYVTKINNPYLGVYPDIGNLKNASLIYNTSVVEDIETGRGHIFAAHLKETIPNHYREIPFGTGHTQYTECINTLRDMGVRMFVSEFWYTQQKNWKDDVNYASKFIRGYLDKSFDEIKK